MKGLIIKEFYGEGKGLAIFHIILGIITLLLSLFNDLQIMFFPYWFSLSYAILYPSFSELKDAEKGFHINAETLPASKTQIVMSKYIVSWLFIAFSVSTIILSLNINIYKYGGSIITTITKANLFILCIFVIYCSLAQIIVMKKLKISMFSIFMIGFMVTEFIFVLDDLYRLFESGDVIIYATAFIAVISYVLSYFKCIDIYKKGVIQ